MKDYADMMEMDHPEIPGHPRMRRKQRAAQFAPFAALNGYGELVEEAIRQLSRLDEGHLEQQEEAVEAQVERIRDPEKA